MLRHSEGNGGDSSSAFRHALSFGLSPESVTFSLSKMSGECLSKPMWEYKYFGIRKRCHEPRRSRRRWKDNETQESLVIRTNAGVNVLSTKTCDFYSRICRLCPASCMIHPGTTPRLKAPDIFPVVLNVSDLDNLCCFHHMWKANTIKCPNAIVRMFFWNSCPTMNLVWREVCSTCNCTVNTMLSKRVAVSWQSKWPCANVI